jgi:hypothetical protein
MPEAAVRYQKRIALRPAYQSALTRNFAENKA